MTRTIYIGIDPGLTTGWAVIHGDHIESGVWRLGPTKGPYLSILYGRIEGLLTRVGRERVGLVCYEEPVARGQAAKILNRQIGVIEVALSHSGAPNYPVNPSTLKRFATTQGRADKDRMREALAEHTNHQPEDDNAVDAVWLAFYAQTHRHITETTAETLRRG
jgi:Holliday junction resolvasome RuvABC endonuclease subunit